MNYEPFNYLSPEEGGGGGGPSSKVLLILIFRVVMFQTSLWGRKLAQPVSASTL